MKSRTPISVLAITAFAAGMLVGCSINGSEPRIDRADLKTVTTDASLSGSGDIAYYGEPGVRADVSALGAVRRAGL